MGEVSECHSIWPAQPALRGPAPRQPDTSLVTTVDGKDDARATAILTEVIAGMKPSMSHDMPSAREWGAALFAHSVLAVLWLVQDGVAVTAEHRWLTLAAQLVPMVKEIGRT